MAATFYLLFTWQCNYSPLDILDVFFNQRITYLKSHVRSRRQLITDHLEDFQIRCRQMDQGSSRSIIEPAVGESTPTIFSPVLSPIPSLFLSYPPIILSNPLPFSQAFSPPLPYTPLLSPLLCSFPFSLSGGPGVLLHILIYFSIYIAVGEFFRL